MEYNFKIDLVLDLTKLIPREVNILVVTWTPFKWNSMARCRPSLTITFFHTETVTTLSQFEATISLQLVTLISILNILIFRIQKIEHFYNSMFIRKAQITFFHQDIYLCLKLCYFECCCIWKFDIGGRV